jgi:hypothetical protein
MIFVIIIGLRRPCPAIDLAGEGHAVVWQSGSLFEWSTGLFSSNETITVIVNRYKKKCS